MNINSKHTTILYEWGKKKQKLTPY